VILILQDYYLRESDERYRGGEKLNALLLIVLFISKFWMVPFRKKKNGQVLQTPKTSWKTVEKPVENR
jgi:hypothetical protein